MRHSPTSRYVNQQRARRVVRPGGEAPGVARAGRHRGLDDDFALERRLPVPGGDEDRGARRGGRRRRGRRDSACRCSSAARQAGCEGARRARRPRPGTRHAGASSRTSSARRRRRTRPNPRPRRPSSRTRRAPLRLQRRLQPAIGRESVGHRGAGGEGDVQAPDARPRAAGQVGREESPTSHLKCAITMPHAYLRRRENARRTRTPARSAARSSGPRPRPRGAGRPR